MIYHSPLKPEIVKGVDFMLIRENCGGAYYGNKVETEDFGSDPWEYRRYEIERVARVAGSLALQHDPPATVWSVDKANVLANSRVWRRVTKEVFDKEFKAAQAWINKTKAKTVSDTNDDGDVVPNSITPETGDMEFDWLVGNATAIYKKSS